MVSMLVFYKELGMCSLADVMIISGHRQQKAIRFNSFCKSFGEVGHTHGVLVSSGSPGQGFPHERMLEVAIPIEFESRSIMPAQFKERHQEENQNFSEGYENVSRLVRDDL
jgi:hypothetical protein